MNDTFEIGAAVGVKVGTVCTWILSNFAKMDLTGLGPKGLLAAMG
jgi:hypothetical protein